MLAEDAGLSLIHLALAFTLTHPAVTAPIIGPRTMEQLESQLGVVDVTLSEDILDRIDKIVPPGVSLNREDSGYIPPGLRQPGVAATPCRLRAAPDSRVRADAVITSETSALRQARGAHT